VTRQRPTDRHNISYKGMQR